VDFYELAGRRQSVRRYSDKRLERDKIEQCIEAARVSPSTSNSQPWKFIVVDDPELKSKLARETVAPFHSFNTFTDQAPVLVAVMTEKVGVRSKTGTLLRNTDFSLIDVGIAAEHFCLQATELGLGTCILGWFHEKAVKRALGIPGNTRVRLLITVGYPADPEIRPKRRKPLDQIRSYNRYE
jgi:nitroreductase